MASISCDSLVVVEASEAARDVLIPRFQDYIGRWTVVRLRGSRRRPSRRGRRALRQPAVKWVSIADPWYNMLNCHVSLIVIHRFA